MTRAMTRTLLRTLLAAAACTAIAVGATMVSVRAQDAPKGDAAKGKQIYMADGCFLCHGRSGQGGGYNGPVPSLAKTELPFEPFKLQLRQPADEMPAYSTAVISDAQIADIYAFVQSLPGRRDPKSIAILNN